MKNIKTSTVDNLIEDNKEKKIVNDDSNQKDKSIDELYVSKFMNNYIRFADGNLNIKLSNRRHFLMEVLKKTKLLQFFSKRLNWVELLRLTEKDEIRDKEISQDISFNNITTYELIAKENILLFKNDFFRFKSNTKRTLFSQNETHIEEQFSKMSIINSTGWYFNLSSDLIDLNNPLKKFFDYVSISVHGFTDTFYIIKFDLKVSSEAQKTFKKILTTKCDRKMLFKNNKHDRDRSPASLYNFGYDAKKYAIRDLELEILSKFFNTFTHKDIYIFNKNKYIPPYTSYFLTPDLDNSIEFCQVVGLQNIPNSISKSIKIKLDYGFFNQPSENKLLRTSVLVEVDKSNKNQPDFWSSPIDDLSSAFSHNLVMNHLTALLDNQINKESRKINLYASKRIFRPRKMLKNRMKTRLYLSNHIRLSKELINYNFTSISERLAAEYGYKDIQRENSFGFKHLFLRYEYHSKTRLKSINFIFDVFDDRLDSSVNNYNLRTAFWSLLLAVASLFIAIIALLLTMGYFPFLQPAENTGLIMILRNLI